MNTNQLLKCIRTDAILNSQCAGVYPLDKIPKPNGVPECIIVNLDQHNKPGSHWIAIFIDPDGIGEYFDSYGRMPRKTQLKTYLRKNCTDWIANTKHLQSLFSSTCGQYCVYYLHKRVRGIPMSKILEVFTSDLEMNDTLVTEYVNNAFDINTDVFEVEFMVNQLCSAMVNK